MTMNMSLTLKHPAALQPSNGPEVIIRPGEHSPIEYKGHVGCGMVLISYAGKEYVMHPGATVELG